MNMTKNIGHLDRTIRFGVGLALVVWGLFSSILLGLLGVLLLVTVAFNWCPAYSVLGIDTRKSDQ
jgi:hypothetical protein